VDSNDRDRIEDAKYELQQLLGEEELKGITLLVYANKMDLPHAMTAAEVSTGLGLVDIRDRQYAIFQSSAIQGHGINDGLDWLVTVLSSQ
jgi:signal recognition particle receptor subunit beta